jgi:hypothetical protein
LFLLNAALSGPALAALLDDQAGGWQPISASEPLLSYLFQMSFIPVPNNMATATGPIRDIKDQEFLS